MPYFSLLTHTYLTITANGHITLHFTFLTQSAFLTKSASFQVLSTLLQSYLLLEYKKSYIGYHSIEALTTNVLSKLLYSLEIHLHR